MKKHRTFYIIFTSVFFLVSILFFYAGYNAEETVSTPGPNAFDEKKFFYVMGAGFLIGPLLLIAPMVFFRWRTRKRQLYLLNHGQKGTATIIQVSRTGVEIDRIPRLLFQMRITTDGGEVYEIRHKELYDVITMGPVPVGKGVPVCIDPKNRKNVLIQW